MLAKKVHALQPAALLCTLRSQMGTELVLQAWCDGSSPGINITRAAVGINITWAAVGQVLIMLLAVGRNVHTR